MPKCVACHGYATHEAKNHPMCEGHASLIKTSKRVLPDSQIPYCSRCGKPLGVLDWNEDRFMFICLNENCNLSRSPQGGENKHSDVMPSHRARRREVVTTEALL